MEIIDYKKIMDTRAPESQRRLVEISREDISPHYSSLTDFMDAALGYEPKLLRCIDRLRGRLSGDRLFISVRKVVMSSFMNQSLAIFTAGIVSTISQMMTCSSESTSCQAETSPLSMRRRPPCSVNLPIRL